MEASVTAGLMWPPEMLAVAYTAWGHELRWAGLGRPRCTHHPLRFEPMAGSVLTTHCEREPVAKGSNAFVRLATIQLQGEAEHVMLCIAGFHKGAPPQ